MMLGTRKQPIAEAVSDFFTQNPPFFSCKHSRRVNYVEMRPDCVQISMVSGFLAKSPFKRFKKHNITQNCHGKIGEKQNNCLP